MSKHPYRALLIWAVVIVALINIYPTIGWMTLEDDERWASLSIEEKEAIQDDESRQDELPAAGTRQAHSVRWAAEDDARAAERPSFFSRAWYQVKRWSEFDRDRVINLGLDLQGGIHMVLGFDWHELDEDRIQQYLDNNYSESDIESEVQETVYRQVSRRIHDFEAKEPVIQKLGTNQIQVQLPGEKDIARARRLITKTALLNFHLVGGLDETLPVFEKIKERFPDDFTPFLIGVQLQGDRFKVPVEHRDRVGRVLEQARIAGDIIPEDKIIAFGKDPKPFEEQVYELYLLYKEPIQSGEGLTSAVAIPDQERSPNWKILFGFSAAEGAKFGAVTGQYMDRIMAIVVDGIVMSAPNIAGRITTNGQITGNFDTVEAVDLAIALNSGSMVVPIKEDYTGIVGASLGADSVRAGVLSAIAGIVIVGAFMLFYYHIAGVIALIALALNAVIVIAAMAYFNMTLTLPGIAGLILTVGMAVDANVLIFERIREELRLGHSFASAIDNGFKRASVTILDANVTTLIAAAVLLQFGTGPIEGFAITLSIGVCASVFTALVVSRAIFDFAVSSKLLTKLTMLSIIKAETKIPFMGWRKIATTASLVFIAVGLVMFGYRGSDNFGVDFTEGTNVNLRLQNTGGVVSSGEVRAALEQAGFEGPTVQEVGEGGASEANRFMIRVGDLTRQELTADEAGGEGDGPEQIAAGADITVSGRIQEALAALAAGSVSNVILDEVQTVGPAIAEQLKWDALKCIVFALVFIVLYVAVRFEIRFAAGAVVALVHDVLVTVGLFALLGRQISMPVVAAILTIIGYSLNDTIVVFDRIREDMALYRGKGYTFLDILNIAINATLSRTLLTSMTTLFVVIVLYFFGGAAINDFALALIIGVIVGTYSSVFIASPVVYALYVLQGKHVQPTDTGRPESGGRYKKAKKGKKNSNAKPSTA